MSIIADQKDEILRILQERFKDTKPVIYFDKCHDPIVYMRSLSQPVPLILVSYKGSLNNETKQYPGVCNFEIYFVDITPEAEELFGVMESVYELFKNNHIIQTKSDGVVSRRRILYYDQGFHAESNEHVIYVQRYNLIP